MIGPPAVAAVPDASPAAAAAAAAPSLEPGASPPSTIGVGDPRSNGAGPGLVGAPFAILIGVVLLGVAAAGATAVYLRWTRPRGG